MATTPVRTRSWRLISYEDGAKGFKDHRSDPDEFNNLADNVAYRDKIKDLEKWLPKEAAPEHKTKSERSRKR